MLWTVYWPFDHFVSHRNRDCSSNTFPYQYQLTRTCSIMCPLPKSWKFLVSLKSSNFYIRHTKPNPCGRGDTHQPTHTTPPSFEPFVPSSSTAISSVSMWGLGIYHQLSQQNQGHTRPYPPFRPRLGLGCDFHQHCREWTINTRHVVPLIGTYYLNQCLATVIFIIGL